MDSRNLHVGGRRLGQSQKLSGYHQGELITNTERGILPKPMFGTLVVTPDVNLCPSTYKLEWQRHVDTKMLCLDGCIDGIATP